jgi:ketosteroid isomerase-like protein
MSQENVSLVRHYYEALNRGGPEEANALIADNFVADASRRPIEPEVLHGRDAALAAALRIYETWGESLRVEPLELIPIGERVIAVVRNRAHGPTSEAKVESTTAQTWTIRDGKLARFEYFGSKDEALAAAGLSE